VPNQAAWYQSEFKCLCNNTLSVGSNIAMKHPYAVSLRSYIIHSFAIRCENLYSASLMGLLSGAPISARLKSSQEERGMPEKLLLLEVRGTPRGNRAAYYRESTALSGGGASKRNLEETCTAERMEREH